MSTVENLIPWTILDTMSNFNFQAIKVFLTYSQVGFLTKEDVYYTITERFPAKRFLIAEENHADGGRHLHAFFHFKTKVRTKCQDCFDIFDGVTQFHPNIKPVGRMKRDEEKVLEYCQKDDPAPLTDIASVPTWGKMREMAETAEEYLGYVEQYFPRDAAMNWDKLKSYANQQFQSDDPMTIREYELPERAKESSARPHLATLTDDGKSTVIYGPAGCGKTTTVLDIAPKPCLLVTHLDGLKRLKKEHKSIVFDDLDFKHLPPHTQKFLVDREQTREIHARYCNAIIPHGMRKFFTSNDYPFLDDDSEDAKAIERRVTRINLFSLINGCNAPNYGQ